MKILTPEEKKELDKKLAKLPNKFLSNQEKVHELTQEEKELADTIEYGTSDSVIEESKDDKD